MTTRKSPKNSAATAGSGSTTCVRSATVPACARSATTSVDWEKKPVIGIINTWSDINPCHVHLRTRAEEVKRGVLQAGGFPLELPAMSLSESSSSRRPCSTATCWRWKSRSFCAAIRSMARCCSAAATRPRPAC